MNPVAIDIGARMGYVSASVLTDFEDDSVKLVVIARDLNSVEEITDAVSISNVCISNHVPFIIVPTREMMHRALKSDTLPETLAYVAVTDPGRAKRSLRRTVEALKHARMPLSSSPTICQIIFLTYAGMY